MNTDILLDCELFRGTNKTNLEELFESIPHRVTTYSKGDIIAIQGDKCTSLYILYKGRVSAKMGNSEGKELNIDYMIAPEVLAPAFIFSSEARFPVTVEAVDEVSICVINREMFLSFMQKNDVVLQNFLRIISDRCLFLSKKLNEFALQSLKDRVINYLKRQKSISNIQDVATMLGVARPSLSRVISEMIDEGVIVKEGNTITLSK